MDGKDARLQIRCSSAVAEQFRVLAQGYDSQGDALRQLLEAHGEAENRLDTVHLESLRDSSLRD
jgi:hypothetical protein